MALIGRGETSAFDELYRRYSTRVLRYFYRMLGNDEEMAQDFLHDIFMKLVERPQLFASGRRFSTWIFSVAHNMCKNEYRSRQVRQMVPAELDELPTAFECELEKIDRREFRAMLDLEIDALDEEHRTAFLLRYQEGFSIREIGEAMGCAEGTVKSRLFYTVRRLAQRLKQFDPRITDQIYE